MEEDAIRVDGKLLLEKDDALGDWYVIRPAFGINRGVSSASVEGTLDEMREIAKAIRFRGVKTFRRCAVRVDDGLAYFWSPHNSTRCGVVPVGIADDLAGQIEALGAVQDVASTVSPRMTPSELAATVRALAVGSEYARRRADVAVSRDDYEAAMRRLRRLGLALDVTADRLADVVLGEERQ